LHGSRSAFHIALAVIGVAVLLLLAWQSIYALLTVFAGAVVGVALRGLTEPVVRWTRLPAGVALALVVLLSLGTVAGVVAGLAPAVASQGRSLMKELPSIVDQLQASLGRLGVSWTLVRELEPSRVLSPEVLFGLFSSAAGVLTAGFVTLVIGVYLAAEPGLYTRGLLRLVPLQRRKRVAQVLDRLERTLRWWLVGQCMSMAILGVLTTFGLWLFGVPYPLLFGVITALMTFVPILGPILAGIPTIAVALTVGPLTGMYVAVFYVGLQSLEGYFLTPMIHRKVISLPPVLILAVQMILFAIVGVIGIVLAMPIVACVMVLVQMLYVQDGLGDRMEQDDPLEEVAE